MSTNTIKKVPDWAKDELYSYIIHAESLSLNLNDYYFSIYSGNIVAPLDAYETTAIANLATRGYNGDPLIMKGYNHILRVMSKNYLTGTNAEFNSLLGDLHTVVGGTFATDIAPLIGKRALCISDSSPLLAQTLETARATAYTSRMDALLYADNYVKERDSITHVLGYGVEFSGKTSPLNAELQRTAGVYDREYRQSTYEPLHNRWVEQQEFNPALLDILGNGIRTITGSEQKTTTKQHFPPQATNALVGSFTGSMTGMAAGSAFGWVGAVVGGVIGGIAGGIGGASQQHGTV